MCLIIFRYKDHPRFNLIFAANRDEFYERPTRAAQFWNKYPQLLAGKDLKSGGTWMGINRNGKIAALTNFRDPSVEKRNPPSRGEIVTNYLTQQIESIPFLKDLHQNAQEYMGFNILLGSPKELYHYSNQEQKINSVEPGMHGLSNHLLDTAWPKVERAKKRMDKETSNIKVRKEALFELLKDDRQARDDQLPDTGISKKLEKQVSPIFIMGEEYGTRSSTILLIDKAGRVTFEERRYENGTSNVVDTKRFDFKIE